MNKDVPLVSTWAWYPGFEEVVDLFNNTHDEVQVCWTNAGSGTAEYDKFSTTIEAGSGAPDVIMLENEVVPSFVIRDSLVDLSEYGANDVAENYGAGAWKDVSIGDGVYAIPVDGGPIGMMYRADIFDEYGIAVPTTWEEFAAAGAQLKAAGFPGYFTNFPTNGNGYLQALLQQAGTEAFSWDVATPTELGVDIDSESTRRVLNYWDGLVTDGVVATDDSFTTDWNTQLATGGYAVNIAAAWGPGYLSGLEGLDEDADWKAAPIPQWTAADDIQVNYGGSTFAVTTQSKQPELAAVVAKEIFGTEEAWKIGIEKATLFPLWLPILNSDYFAAFETPFFGGQESNAEVFIPASNGYAGMAYSPFQSTAYEKVTDRLYDAMVEKKTTVDEAAGLFQQDIVDYATAQGFIVE